MKQKNKPEKPVNKIDFWLKQKGMSRQALADKIGCDDSQITFLIQGLRKFTPKWQVKIAEALELEIEDLLIETETIKKIIEINKDESFLFSKIDTKELILDKSLLKIYDIKSQDLIVMQMPDESMAPDIKINSYLVIDKSQTTINEKADGIYLFILKDKIYIRKIQSDVFNNTILFKALNSLYSDSVPSSIELKKLFAATSEENEGINKAFKVLGKVVFALTSF